MTKLFYIEGKPFSLTALRQRARVMMGDGALSDFKAGVWAFIDEWLNDADTVGLQTSGSTGTPQQITMPKRYMRQSAQMTIDFFGLSPNDKVLCCLPASYIAGKMMIVRALEGALDLLLAEPNANVLAGVDDEIDFVAMVPLQLENVIRDHPQELDKLKHVLLGGAPISASLEERVRDIATPIWHSYGMTETVSHVAMRRVNGPGRQETYTPMPKVNLSLDQRHCLQIDAPHLSPELVVTNDIVAFDTSGAFRFVGRYDNVINTGGVKVSPELIEQKIAHLISSRFMVSSRADERLGQQLVLLVEGGEDAIAQDQLMQQMKELLNSFETPKAIVFVSHFEETSSGKLKRTIV